MPSTRAFIFPGSFSALAGFEVHDVHAFELGHVTNCSIVFLFQNAAAPGPYLVIAVVHQCSARSPIKVPNCTCSRPPNFEIPRAQQSCAMSVTLLHQGIGCRYLSMIDPFAITFATPKYNVGNEYCGTRYLRTKTTCNKLINYNSP